MSCEASSMGAAAAPRAGDGELFRSRGAQLVLVEGDERVLMQSGDFVMVLVKNVVSQLAAVVAMVGEVQWPVGRDATVEKEGEANFCFSLPGPLRYSVELGSAASAEDVHRLEKLMEKYTAGASVHEQSTAAGGPNFADLSDHVACPAPKKRACDETSLLMVGRMQRARRMSAVAKVFSKSLERGAINAVNHVEPMAIAAPDLRVSSPSAVSNLALAGVEAVAKVVDAVETGGRTLLENAGSAVAAMDAPLQRSKPGQAESGTSFSHGLSSSGWTLNKSGLLMLFRVITTSMAIHSSGSSSRGSSRSGSSSSSEFHRLLSSSSSSSSFSSKSPTTPSRLQGGGDATSTAIRQPALTVGAARSSSPPAPPPPPLFTSHASRLRHSDMPPPSGRPLPIVTISSDSQVSGSFRIYKPRPTPAVASSAPPAPLPFLPRPPRFQPPPQN